MDLIMDSSFLLDEEDYKSFSTLCCLTICDPHHADLATLSLAEKMN
jgi:hypothetical protein